VGTYTSEGYLLSERESKNTVLSTLVPATKINFRYIEVVNFLPEDKLKSI